MLRLPFYAVMPSSTVESKQRLIERYGGHYMNQFPPRLNVLRAWTSPPTRISSQADQPERRGPPAQDSPDGRAAYRMYSTSALLPQLLSGDN